MGKEGLPQTLSLERFASGKNGQTNAFKKRKQAIKQKIIHKAKLKREYAKILKREGIEDPRTQHDHDDISENEDTSGEADAQPTRASTASKESRTHGSEMIPGEPEYSDITNARLPKQHRDAHHSRKGKRQSHRPDPFREAKAKAEKRKREEEEKQRERARQHAEKEERARKRKRQHALLSKRTKGGQPVMRHTMQHLLEKIKAQT